jgi:hypothetical protein
MEHITFSVVALAIGLFMVIWFFLLQMIMSQAPDAHLQILLDLMSREEERPADRSSQGPLPSFVRK